MSWWMQSQNKRAWKGSALIKERDWEDLLWDPVHIHIGRCLRVRHFLSMLNLKSYFRSHGLYTWVCNSGWDPGTHTFKGHKVRQKIFLLTFFVVFAEAQMEIWRHLKLPTCLVLLLKSGLLVDSSHCMTNKPRTLFHLNCLPGFCFVGFICCFCNYHLTYYQVCVWYMSVEAGIHNHICVVRRQFSGVGSLHPFCWDWVDFVPLTVYSRLADSWTSRWFSHLNLHHSIGMFELQTGISASAF